MTTFGYFCNSAVICGQFNIDRYPGFINISTKIYEGEEFICSTEVIFTIYENEPL